MLNNLIGMLALEEQDEGGGLQPSLSLAFILGSIFATKGGVAPTFARATTKISIDHEGLPRLLLSGEVPFDGLRRVRNLVGFSQTFTDVGWLDSATITKTQGIADPIGGTTAVTIQANAVNSYFYRAFGGAVAGNTAVTSIWIRRRTGAGTIKIIDANNVRQVLAGVDGTWRRFAVSAPTGASNAGVEISTSGDAVDIAFVQVEDVTGQSNQNPSEYIATNVLASPWYGANVDGVRRFNTVNGNSVSGTVVTEATGLAIPLGGIGVGRNQGVSTGSFSTPDSVALAVLGDIDLQIWMAPDDWTPAGSCHVIAQWGGAGARAYRLILTAAGALQFQGSVDGTASTYTALSSATNTFVDGTAHWVRATRNATTGDVNFYTSENGTTWTALGVVQATAPGALFNSAQSLAVMAQDSGGTNTLKGNCYQACVYAVIGGATPVACFKATDWTAGATMVSSTTGEIWTANAGAWFMKWPVQGYFPHLAATNLCLQSEDFSTTWTAVGTPTRVAAALRCGAVKLDLIGDDDAAALEGYLQPITFTGDAVKAISVLFAQNTSLGSVIQLFDSTGAASRLMATITWVSGFPTVTMTTGTLLGVDSLGNGVFRARMASTAVTAANVNELRFFPASDAAGAVANVGAAYFGGAMAENATVCSPYIATTTVTVTVNKDDMALTALGAWFNPVAGSVISSFVNGNTAANVKLFAISDGTTAERYTAFVIANVPTLIVVDGGATQATLNGAALAVGAASKLGMTYAVNDFELYDDGVRSGAGDQLGTLPSPTRLDIGQSETQVAQFSGGVRTLDYYPQRLPNTKLAQLST